MADVLFRGIIYEDNGIAALSIRFMLESFNCECQKTYDSADDILENVSTHDPDFILMDIMLLGEKTGLEATEELRKERDTPVLFISALSNKNTLSRIKAIPQVGLLSKPYTEHDLKKALLLNLVLTPLLQAVFVIALELPVFPDSTVQLYPPKLTEVPSG